MYITILAVNFYWVGVDPMYINPMLGKPENQVFSPEPKEHKMTLLLIGFDLKIDKTHCWTFLARMMCDVNKYMIPLTTNKRDTKLGLFFVVG